MSHLFTMLDVLTAPLPNPAPVDPTGGSAGVSLLLGYIKWGALGICGAVALASGGYMAWGSVSDRPEAQHRGKRALLVSGLGVIATALAIPVINSVTAAVG